MSEVSEIYTVGDRTAELVFRAADITNLADLQKVLDQVEVALKQAREEALREAAERIDRKIKQIQPEMSRRAQRLAAGKKPGFQYAIHRADLDARMSDRDAILALITEDQTNG